MRKIIFVLAAVLIAAHTTLSSAAEVGRADVIHLGSHIPHHISSLWGEVLSGSIEGSNLLVALANVNHSKLLKNNRKASTVVELMLHDAIAGCDSGELNLLPLNDVLPVGAVIEEYVWNSIQPCAIGHSIWATFAVFDTKKYPDQVEPATLADFFNTVLFPGKRAIRKSPQALFEWTLLNQGVAKQQVYSSLSSVDGWMSARKTLEQLRNDIIWVETDQEALELLDNNLASFAMVSSPNLVRHVANQTASKEYNHGYGVIWHNAVAHMNFLAIPKESATGNSTEFLRLIANPVRNLKMSTAMGYAPVRREQLELINKRYRFAMPLGDHAEDLFWINNRWWRETGNIIAGWFNKFTEEKVIRKSDRSDVTWAKSISE